MQKKSLLALLLVLAMVMSGCALVTVDQKADMAQIIIDVNGETVNKQTLLNGIQDAINQNQQMNQMYAYMGMQANLPTDYNTVANQTVEGYIQMLVAGQKAKELGMDQMTEEENAEIAKAADEQYQDYLKQVAERFLADSKLEGEELTAAAEKYVADNGMAGKDEFVKAVAEAKAQEKLEADTVKAVEVTDEELTAEATKRADQEKADYEANPDLYGSKVNSGAATYYAPAGYRYVKHILVKYTEEDSKAIAEKQTALNEANSVLAAAKADLEAAEEGADTEALKANVTAAETTVAEATAALDAAKAAAKANIQAKLDEVYAKATAEGADFDALVAEYNEDKGMPAAGYALRENFAQFVKSFTDAGMALTEVGQVSQPVESNYGFHIIQYSADIAEGAADIETVREALHAEMLKAAQQKFFAEKLNEWVEAADVKLYLERMNVQ